MTTNQPIPHTFQRKIYFIPGSEATRVPAITPRNRNCGPQGAGWVFKLTTKNTIIGHRLLPIPTFKMFKILIINFTTYTTVDIHSVRPADALQHGRPLCLVRCHHGAKGVFLQHYFPSSLPIYTMIPRNVMK